RARRDRRAAGRPSDRAGGRRGRTTLGAPPRSRGQQRVRLPTGGAVMTRLPKISRRTALLGLGGVGGALPALEIMAPRFARADINGSPPSRFVISYGGVSLGIASTKYVIPATVGAGYEITRGLQPLADHGVADQVSIVSGLKIPWQTTGAVPPG